MQRRDRRTGEKIKNDILDYMEKMDFPNTTENIAKKLGLNWYSAMRYLHDLRAEGKVFHKKIGRQDQWWTENVNESRRLLKVLKEKVEKLEIGSKEKDKRIKEVVERNRKLEKENSELRNKSILK